MDGELLADLFDTLLQEVLEGRTPDVASFHADRPDLRDRINKTWALACSVAGRREPSRPVMGGYEILRELGHGGMGTVYLARHQALQREVAIKVLPHSLAMSPRAKLRFLEEARALARVQHENVVHIHRIIDHAEMLAFEMEFVDGPSLQKLILELRQKPKPQAIASLAEVLGVASEGLGTRNSAEWFVRLGIRIGRALGEVHRHGLVHRDVKPSNILLRADGRPVLADFGLARDGVLDASRTGAFAGTPVYAAPERLRGGDGDVDARADIYSLGVTLYEALSLVPPFAGSTTHEVLRRIEDGDLASLRKHAPHVSRDLEIVLGKAMERDARHRYATADEFADDLERLLSLQPIHARPAGPVRRTLKFVRRQHKVVMAAAAGAVLVALLAWPIFAHARAATEAQTRAAAAQHAARSRLLCAEIVHASGMLGLADGNRQLVQAPERRVTQLAALARCLGDYDLALSATPNDLNLRLERDVVAAAANLLRVAAEPTQEPPTEDRLPPLTRLIDEQAKTHTPQPEALAAAIAAAAPTDRLAAGLLAYLTGYLGASHACWDNLSAQLPNHALLDACLALQSANDGNPALAYPQLFHAAREFPDSSALAFAIAEAALSTGDLRLAQQWLASIPSEDEPAIAHSRRQLLEADLLAAGGNREAARRLCREVARSDPSDPEALRRLAGLAQIEGNLKTARQLYQVLLARWPDLARVRLELARVELQRRDLPAYLEHARFALTQDLRRCSLGAAQQLADILRIGGLNQLHRELGTRLGLVAGAGRHDDAIPLAGWLSEEHVAAIERGLRIVSAFELNAQQASQVDPRPLGVALRSTWLLQMRAPSLNWLLPASWQATVLVGIPALIGAPTDWMAQNLLPFQRSLGTRLQRVREAPLVITRLENDQADYGRQIFAVDDLDENLLPELCITSPPRHQDGLVGKIEFRSLDDGSLLRTWTNDEEEACFGNAVAPLGDVDGDYCTDVLVGAPIAKWDTQALASVQLRSGRTGERLWTIRDESIGFGAALATLGDLDGDGIRDFVVGAPPMTFGQDHGRASIRSGRTGGVLHELAAERSDTWFAARLANAHDVNGDGFDDVLVGGNFGQAPGLVSLFDGKTGALLMSLGEESATKDFGATLVGLGDVDGDGSGDFAIGAPGVSSEGREAGEVLVISGRTGRTLCTLRGERPGDLFGFVICALPDWNRSGVPAIAVTAARGGPVGTGYVRVFGAASGTPLQTFAGNSGNLAFGLSLADLGDRNGDGQRDLGIRSLNRSGLVAIWSVSLADAMPQSPPPKAR